jgi:predicted DNA-binding transcriptional regulator AlpA
MRFSGESPRRFRPSCSAKPPFAASAEHRIICGAAGYSLALITREEQLLTDIRNVEERKRRTMIHRLIDQKVLAEYLRVNQALIEEIVRDQQKQEAKASAALASSGDQMLTAKDAAARLACSEDWLYRNAKKLPFARKLGPKNLRFSQRGLEKWLAARQLN